MKIIKEPVPVSWSIEKECIADVSTGDYGCGAVLEVDMSDIYPKMKMQYGYDERDGESYRYQVQIFVFRCPCCGKETSIKDNDIPDKIRKIIVNKEKEKKESNNQKKLSKS